MRALRLALQLANSQDWCDSLAASGGVAATLQLAGLLQPADSLSDSNSSNASVQLSALQLLPRLMRVSHTAAAAVLLARQQVLDGLMSVVLAAGTAPAAMPAATGNGKSKAAGPDAASKAVRVPGRMGCPGNRCCRCLCRGDNQAWFTLASPMVGVLPFILCHPLSRV